MSDGNSCEATASERADDNPAPCKRRCQFPEVLLPRLQEYIEAHNHAVEEMTRCLHTCDKESMRIFVLSKLPCIVADLFRQYFDLDEERSSTVQFYREPPLYRTFRESVRLCWKCVGRILQKAFQFGIVDAVMYATNVVDAYGTAVKHVDYLFLHTHDKELHWPPFYYGETADIEGEKDENNWTDYYEEKAKTIAVRDGKFWIVKKHIVLDGTENTLPHPLSTRFFLAHEIDQLVKRSEDGIMCKGVARVGRKWKSVD